MDPTATTAIVTDPILSQLTASSIAVWLIQRLKSAPWFPALDANSSVVVQRVFAVATATLTTVGINWSYDASLGVLTVTGLTVAGIADALWAFLQSLVAQQVIYHGVVKPEAVRNDLIKGRY